MWKWIKRVILAVLGFLALVILVISAWGQILLSRTFEAEPRTVLLSSRPDVLAEGERLAQVFGCYRGCHGRRMEGVVFVETPVLDRVVAPNLTRAVRQMSTGELEALIRQGVKPDGRSAVLMPSAGFAGLSDSHLAAILSFIREFEPQEQDLGASRHGLLARGLLVIGLLPLEAEHVKGRPPTAHPTGGAALGEYLAMNACSECHGLDLEGRGDFAPSLAVARAYDREQFEGLMREGAGLGGRDLGMMSHVAKLRFSNMNEQEIDALHAFLRSRP